MLCVARRVTATLTLKTSLRMGMHCRVKRTLECKCAMHDSALVVDASYIIYALPMLGLWAWYLHRRRAADTRSRHARTEAVAAGLAEPASLHPLIDLSVCVGCGACVRACRNSPNTQYWV